MNKELPGKEISDFYIGKTANPNILKKKVLILKTFDTNCVTKNKS